MQDLMKYYRQLIEQRRELEKEISLVSYRLGEMQIKLKLKALKEDMEADPQNIREYNRKFRKLAEQLQENLTKVNTFN